MTRDTIKDKKYFDDFINEDSKRIDNFCEKLNSGKILPTKINAVKQKIHELQLGIIIAKYSRGDDLKTIKIELEQILNNWYECFDADCYQNNLNLISLAILFNLEQYLIPLKEKIKSIEDWIIAYIFEGNNSNPLVYSEHYEHLRNLLLGEKSIERIKVFIENTWYDPSLEIFELHLADENLYNGYWCFEVAAIIKKYSIDDSELKGLKFYPYDLVHFKD